MKGIVIIENKVVKNTPAEAAFTSPSYSVDKITTIEADGKAPETTISDFIKSSKGSLHTNKYNMIGNTINLIATNK